MRVCVGRSPRRRCAAPHVPAGTTAVSVHAPLPSAAMAAAQLAPAEALNAYGVAFRDYTVQETPRQKGVRAFYTEQHAKQSYAWVQTQHAKHLGLQRRELLMSIWEAAGARARDATLTHASHCIPWRAATRGGALTPGRRALAELLNEVVDDSDPDLDLPQARGGSGDPRSWQHNCVPRCFAPRCAAPKPRRISRPVRAGSSVSWADGFACGALRFSTCFRPPRHAAPHTPTRTGSTSRRSSTVRALDSSAA